MKKIAVAVLFGLALGSIGVANAAGYKNTVSIGYAYTDLSGWLSGNANGANIKYNWEDLDSGFGAMGSVTYTSADIHNYGYKVGDADYTSLLVGPSYRFNDYLSAYVMIGAANGHIKDNWGNSDNKAAFAYGAGIQLNPIENIAVNASYEHTRFSTDADSDVKAGTWVLGVGYSF
ncbi:outer membrane beta-barrel protein [Salmonella enterica]|uniref:Ail/OmpX n=2 Tax=Salmonella enterica TaxID=28901 RepID=A0A5U4F9K6_SALER|nr:Ail/Lom family outer membrane beta-barrel protein [Salmonella enterica]ECM0355576.1 outer membrane beta-barrel protein [Salmonella enterica subsp. enterica serovar Rubislaw]ECY7636699.1 outer membrane beta-barrel protein [Salmonella enterica subsp. enterica serovar Oranienburg]EDB4092437.1 outer membrane beta-barrel protein [Salmonella enterica subsp. enterica serovar Typhimurium]EDF6290719.1 outer membrane beta-barrel protein [Salmonella enterica subsp. enterica serovar Newport]EDO1573639.